VINGQSSFNDLFDFELLLPSWQKSYYAQLTLARSSNVPFYYLFNVHFVCFLAYYYDIIKCTKNKKRLVDKRAFTSNMLF